MIPLANARSPRGHGSSTAVSPGRPASLLRQLLLEAAGTGARTVHVEPAEEGWQVRMRRASGLTSRRICYTTGLGHRLTRLHRRMPFVVIPAGRYLIQTSIHEIETFQGISWILRTRLVPRVAPTLDDIVADHVTRQHLRDVLALPSGLIVLSSHDADSTTLLRAAIAQHCIAPDRRVLRLEESSVCHPPGSIGCVLTPALREDLSPVAELDADVIVLGDIKVDPVVITRLVRQTSDTALVIMYCKAVDVNSTLQRLYELDPEHRWVAHRTVAMLRHDEVALLCTSCSTPTGALAPMVERDVQQWMHSVMHPGRECPGCEHCHYSGIGGTEDTLDVLSFDDTVREHLRLDRRERANLCLENQRRIPAALNRSVRAGLVAESEAQRVGKRDLS